MKHNEKRVRGALGLVALLLVTTSAAAAAVIHLPLSPSEAAKYGGAPRVLPPELEGFFREHPDLPAGELGRQLLIHAVLRCVGLARVAYPAGKVDIDVTPSTVTISMPRDHFLFDKCLAERFEIKFEP